MSAASSINTLSTKHIGSWTVTQNERELVDWEYYSRAYHRQFGPKVSIDDRHVVFSRPWGRGMQVIVHPMKHWRGDWLSRAIIEAGLAPKACDAPMSVRLTKAHDAKLLRKEKNGDQIYRRTLLGQTIDMVIKRGRDTYHTPNYPDWRKQLTAGLERKIAAREKAKADGPLITIRTARRLGFCEVGIQAFIDEFDLHPESSYTLAKLKEIVGRNPDAAKTYAAELKMLFAQ